MGCERNPRASGAPRVLRSFGGTGRGPGEFLYPRAIAAAPDRTLCVIDKAGRVQWLDREGRCLSTFTLAAIAAGKPTGASVGPEGHLYIADTHYHRVQVLDTQGRVLRQFGRYGKADGCFIYPTDVTFAPDGRIFVSEYGGNDRISVFNAEGQFLYAFGSHEQGPLILARPSALCLDSGASELYIADACHHRVVVVDLEGRVLRTLGGLGREPGQLRYPYDLALLSDGRLVVCEYGNNRLQVFERSGRSQALYGSAGRELGQLAYPWGVVVDREHRAYIVDAGNNRIQVWQL
jgi:DNA-binding beta-propeller fold protein YncE